MNHALHFLYPGSKMSLLSQSEARIAKSIAGIGQANPFLPERMELEKQALGNQFVDRGPFHQYRPDATVETMFPNATALRSRGTQLLEKMRTSMLAGQSANESELLIYEDLAMYVLYARYMSSLFDLPIMHYPNRPERSILAAYADYRNAFKHYLELPEQHFPSSLDADFMFAGLFQIERAFFHVFRYIVGGSHAAARLRAAVWQSVFTHDMRRYSRSLYRVMGNIPTLIEGPSGTGKELVARAIAYSRFIEFDAQNKRFSTDYTQCFHGLNLSAIPSALVESELFGHVKGAYTGASKDRTGQLDEAACQRWDTVFLDEIGELDGLIQVKLLRVLQDREFRRVGDREVRRFSGKIVAATNLDLAVEMDAGGFREDFYYRLCADRITTPSLHEQLQEAPDDLANFVRFIASQLLPHLEEEVEKLSMEAVSWINRELGADYSWPGNIRELEQCVRSIMIRGSYSPAIRPESNRRRSFLQRFLADVEQGRLTRNELLETYTSLVYTKCGSYRSAAKRLDTDWRTVQKLVNLTRVTGISKPNEGQATD